MSTRSRVGDFTKNIRVQTNDPEHRSVSLVCKGRALVPFKTTPKIANFGRISRDSGEVTKTIALARGDGGPLKPVLKPSKHEHISAELRELTPGEAYELEVTITPPWPNDRLRGTVSLETGIDEVPSEDVRVFAQIDPRLKAMPARFSVPGNVPSDMDLKVRLLWSGGEPGKILSAQSPDPQMTVRVEEQDNQQFVVLHVPAGYERERKRTMAVTVKTDDAAAASLRIPVSVSASHSTHPVKAPSLKEAAQNRAKPAIAKPVRAQPAKP